MDANPEPEPQKVELNTTQDLTEDSEENEIPDATEPLAKNAVAASPTIRRMARELRIDINLVEGTGPGGRISEDDIRNYAPGKRSKPKSEPQAPEPPVIEPQDLKDKVSSDKWGNIDRTPMSKVRKLTAERLTKAWIAPHVTQYDKADITELEKLRKEFGDSVTKAGGKLTMTSIILKVIASALKAFPEFNASVDMENGEILYKKYYNIGVAVDTDRGLLVPVIKDVNKKNITKLSVELSELSEKARNKKITVNELQGGTFTISNLGGIGGTYFSPVLNAPEVAILGISRSAIEPVYIDGGFLPRLMLPLSLSYDHRLIDGADAIRFLRWIIEALEEPFKIPLEG
jgi:pyruvate dehydrogenase E2 component (dihydrolipoamide acetyltransferase)